MKFSIISLVFLLFVPVVVEAGTYTLEELIETGYRNSEKIKMVEEEIRKADYKVKEAIGSAFPRIDISAYYQYAFEQYFPISTGETEGFGLDSLIQVVDGIDPEAEPGAYDLGQAFLGMMGGFSDMVSGLKDQTFSLELTLQQTLFARGKVGLGLKVAKVYRKTLLDKYDDTRLAVRSDITKLFYGVLLSGQNVAIQEEAVRLSGEALRLSRLRFEVGSGSEVDTLSSRLHYEKSLIELQAARSREKMALEALILETDLEETVGSFFPVGELPSADYTITLEEALSKMERDNRQLHQLRGGEELRELAVKLTKSNFLPLVYCGGSIGKYARFDAGEKPEWFDDRKVFIGMSLNLFNGGMKVQNVRQARADHNSFRHSMELAEDGLELAVRNACETLETSRGTLVSTRSLLRLAEKGYDVARRSYEVGLSTLLDLEKAEFELKSARMAVNAAQHDFLRTVVNMKRLTYSLD